MGQRKERVARTEVQGTDHRQGLFRRRRCSLPPGQSRFSESEDQRKLPSRIPLHPQQAAWDRSPSRRRPRGPNLAFSPHPAVSMSPCPCHHQERQDLGPIACLRDRLSQTRPSRHSQWANNPLSPSALNVMARIIVILTSLGPHPDERECGSKSQEYLPGCQFWLWDLSSPPEP